MKNKRRAGGRVEPREALLRGRSLAPPHSLQGSKPFFNIGSKKGWAEVRLPREETGDSWHLWLLRAIQLLAYESRKLNGAERPYAVHEKELRGRPAIKLDKER
uniref:Uncharacterized protein n=1 Tax=Cajanus cajan TaxID=3821 RepID=A0A151UEY6_CAJCA